MEYPKIVSPLFDWYVYDIFALDLISGCLWILVIYGHVTQRPQLQAFYDPPSASTLELWLQFVVEWTKEVSTHSQKAEGSSQALKSAAARMRLENPKYVPREWMLVAAYNAANEEVFAPVLELHELFKKPYDEQPEMEAKYFRKAKDDDLRKAGTAYMS